MNSVKVAYLIVVLMEHIFFYSMAVITPIYFTEGYYWWSAIFVLLSILQGCESSKRFNSWEGFGSNE